MVKGTGGLSRDYGINLTKNVPRIEVIIQAPPIVRG
jgi:hypothetical protein